LGAVVVRRSVINSNRDIDTPQTPPNGQDLPTSGTQHLVSPPHLSSSKSSYETDSDSSLDSDLDPETVMTFTEAAAAIGGMAMTVGKFALVYSAVSVVVGIPLCLYIRFIQ